MMYTSSEGTQQSESSGKPGQQKEVSGAISDVLQRSKNARASLDIRIVNKDESGNPAKGGKQVTILQDVKEESTNNWASHSLKQDIFGGSLYSKALLRGSRSTESVLKPNAAFQFLEGTQHLFFRKCKTFPPELSSFKPKHKRGIWNSSGRVVYYTGERSRYYCKCCLYSGFIHEVVDYTGRFVIISEGRQFIFGLNSHVKIYMEDGKLLGSMNQSCLSSTYEIKDATGRLIYIIQAPCFAPCAPFVFWCCKEHFEICMDDGVSEIGKITKYWGDKVAIDEFKSCLGIEMDNVDDVRVKALLLGCFFLIEYQYYSSGGNGPCYLFLMLLLLCCFILGVECGGYCPLQKVLPYLGLSNLL